jgi:hypothetical protein
MRHYIFITTEGYTYQPGSESDTPDVENSQVLGFGKGVDIFAAFENFVDTNLWLKNTSFNEVIAYELKYIDKTANYFCLDDYNGPNKRPQSMRIDGCESPNHTECYDYEGEEPPYLWQCEECKRWFCFGFGCYDHFKDICYDCYLNALKAKQATASNASRDAVIPKNKQHE